MDDTTFRMAIGATERRIGQQEWTIPSTYEFVVPDGIYLLSAVAIGGGGGGGMGDQSDGASARGGTGAAGGNNRWIRDMPVVPGEIITVTVGAGGLRREGNSRGATSGGASYISRGAVTLLRADGAAGASAGTNNSSFGLRSDGSFVGGGDGGPGAGAQGGGGAGAGGTGGYAGNGGNAYVSPPVQPAGGAGGGGATRGNGGSVGLHGEGSTGINGIPQDGSRDGTDGSARGITCGGGGQGGDLRMYGQPGKNGGIRIIWGTGRSYPSTRIVDEF